MKKAIALIVLAVFFTSIASASIFTVDGLQEKDINRSFTDSGMHFEAPYMNQTVAFKNATYPDELHQYLTKWTTSTTIKENSSQLDFQSEFGASAPDYLAGKKINEKISMKKGKTKSTLYNGMMVADGGNVTIEVTADAHYEHLVLNYDIYANVTVNGTTQRQLMGSYQDVYSGEDPERVSIFGDLQKKGDGEFQYQVSIDNKYDPEKEYKIVQTFYNSDEATFEGFNSGGAEYEVCNVDYTTYTEPLLNDAGIGQEYKLDNPDDWTSVCRNVTVEADSITTASFSFTESDDPNTIGGDTTSFIGYVLGSASAFSVTTDSDWQNRGTFSGTESTSGVLELSSSNLILDDFEDNDLSEYSVVTGSITDYETQNTTVYNGQFSVKAQGGSTTDEIVRPMSQNSPNDLQVALRQSGSTYYGPSAIWRDSNGTRIVRVVSRHDRISVGNLTYIHNQDATWYLVELRGLNYSTNSIAEVYINDVLRGTNVDFTNPGSEIVDFTMRNDRIDSNLQSYWDDASIGGSIVTSGNWTGNPHNVKPGEKPTTIQVNASNLNSNSEAWVTVTDAAGLSQTHKISDGVNNYTITGTERGGEVSATFNLTGTNPQINSYTIHTEKVTGSYTINQSGDWDSEGAYYDTYTSNGNMQLRTSFGAELNYSIDENTGTPASGIDFSPTQIAVGNENGDVFIYDRSTGNRVQTLTDAARINKALAETVRYSHDYSMLITLDYDLHNAYVYNTTTWNLIQTINVGDDVYGAAWATDDSKVAIGTKAGARETRVYRVSDWAHVATYAHGNLPTGMEYTPDYYIGGDYNNEVQVYDANNDSSVTSFGTGGVGQTVETNAAETLASVSMGNATKLYDIGSWTLNTTLFTDGTSNLNSWIGDSYLAISDGSDVEVYNKTFGLEERVSPVASMLRGIHFSDDGEMMGTTHENGETYIYNAYTAKTSGNWTSNTTTLGTGLQSLDAFEVDTSNAAPINITQSLADFDRLRFSFRFNDTGTYSVLEAKDKSNVTTDTEITQISANKTSIDSVALFHSTALNHIFKTVSGSRQTYNGVVQTQ